MAGRRTKYTPDTVDAICEAIRNGSTQHDAAVMAGVGKTVFYEWYSLKPEFAEAVEKAHADFKQKNVTAIRAAGIRADKTGHLSGSWQANAWLLERKYPEEFGQRMTLKLDPEQYEVLKRHGLTPRQAMEQLINALDEDKVDADASA